MEYHSFTDLFSLVDDAGDIEAEVIEDLLCGGREPKRRHANLTVRVLQRCREESERDRQTHTYSRKHSNNPHQLLTPYRTFSHPSFDPASMLMTGVEGVNTDC